jgi:hypothetical protein
LLTEFNVEARSQLRALPRRAFFDCKRLDVIDLPESVESLDRECFVGCTALSVIGFPVNSMLKTIQSRVFSKCRQLSVLSLRGAVQTVDVRSFAESSVRVLQIDAGNQELTESNGILFDHPCTRLILALPTKTEIEIPATVQVLGQQCFSGCPSLRSVTYQEGCQLQEIRDGAFIGCSELTSINIPNSVTALQPNCFATCPKFARFEVQPRSVIQDISRVFERCHALETVVIPDSVVILTIHCFHECNNLQEIVFTEDS